jgi:hypothetical protein
MNQKRLLQALAISLLGANAYAGTLTINPTPVTSAGAGAGTTVAVTKVTYTPAGGDTTAGLQTRVEFDGTRLAATAVGVAPFACSVQNPGTATAKITIVGNDPALAALGTFPSICDITFTTAATFTTGTTPLTLVITGAPKGCFNAVGGATACTVTSGSVNIVAGNTWTATPNPLVVGSTQAGGTAGPTNLLLTATAGNLAAGSITGCTFAGANAASFNSSATFPLVLTQTGVTNLPIRFQPPALAVAGAQTATVSCTGAGGTILSGFPVTLNGTVLAGNTASLTPATLNFPSTVVGANSATQNVVISAPATNTGSITINTCTIGGANATQFNFNPAFASTVVAAGATANVPVRFSPTAAGSAAGSVTCTTSTVGATVTGTTALAGTATPPVSALTAVTASGTTVTLPSYNIGLATSSSANLTFNATVANGALACVATGAGYTATPNPLNLVVGTPGVVTVTFTGNVAGTFTGTLTCTPVAPATGGPFTYPLSTTVGLPIATVAVPTLGNFGLLLLVAGFLGLGVVLVNRRQA